MYGKSSGWYHLFYYVEFFKLQATGTECQKRILESMFMSSFYFQGLKSHLKVTTASNYSLKRLMISVTNKTIPCLLSCTTCILKRKCKYEQCMGTCWFCSTCDFLNANFNLCNVTFYYFTHTLCCGLSFGWSFWLYNLPFQSGSETFIISISYTYNT